MAVKWARKNIWAFGGDNTRIALVGESSGGTLAMASGESCEGISQVQESPAICLFAVRLFLTVCAQPSCRVLFGSVGVPACFCCCFSTYSHRRNHFFLCMDLYIFLLRSIDGCIRPAPPPSGSD